MWGAGGTDLRQTLYANNPGDWYVTASVTDNTSGAVLTYPNTGFTMPENPVDGYSTITSSWSDAIPRNSETVGWAAYDLWLNSWADEVMIQTDLSVNSYYDCATVATATFEGEPWHMCRFGSERVWKPGTDDAHLNSQSSGTVDIKSMLTWMEQNGYLPAGSVWTAGSFGFEICHTTTAPEKFQVTGFFWTAK